MSIPSFWKMMLPFLKRIADGKEYFYPDLFEDLAKDLALELSLEKRQGKVFL